MTVENGRTSSILTIEDLLKMAPEYRQWDHWFYHMTPNASLDDLVTDVLSCVVTLENKLVPITPEEDQVGGAVKDWRSVCLRRIRIVATNWRIVYDEMPNGEDIDK